MTVEVIDISSMIWSLIAVGTFIMLFFVTAPYGRHSTSKWGATIDNRLGWVIMEFPSLAIMAAFLMIGIDSMYGKMLAMLWIVHYVYRSFIFPQRLRTKGKRMPVAILFSAIFFNCINAGLNGWFLYSFSHYTDDAFLEWNFSVGAALFLIGAATHITSDNKLIHLRKPGEIGYKIPRGGLFSKISCPNLLGEILEWTGFAVMAMSWPATSFAIWTAANLIPRAWKHHQWYHEQFDDYPSERKAIIPWVF